MVSAFSFLITRCGHNPCRCKLELNTLSSYPHTRRLISRWRIQQACLPRLSRQIEGIVTIFQSCDHHMLHEPGVSILPQAGTAPAESSTASIEPASFCVNIFILLPARDQSKDALRDKRFSLDASKEGHGDTWASDDSG